MIVVAPYDIINGLLSSSSIPEPDASAGEIVWSAGTTPAGQLRILTSTHKVYKAVVDTTDDPLTGIGKSTPTWIEVGYTNRYRMFDQVNSSQSTSNSAITFAITSPSGFDSAAIFNATNVTSVRYVLTSSGGAVVYDKTIEAIDNSARVDWWHYFFEPIVQRYKFFVNDIPRQLNSTLTVTINGNAPIGIGTMVIGKQVNLGVACYGTSFRYINLSTADEDDFGNIKITKKRKYKLLDYDVRTDKPKIDFIINKISGLVDQPCVWAGTPDTDDPTVVYGYYVDFRQNIDTPTKCTATLQVREIV